ncbi:hypothetical protein HDU79_012072, partial [Rhizoclosmatium sp. JEL0117]
MPLIISRPRVNAPQYRDHPLEYAQAVSDSLDNVFYEQQVLKTDVVGSQTPNHGLLCFFLARQIKELLYRKPYSTEALNVFDTHALCLFLWHSIDTPLHPMDMTPFTSVSDSIWNTTDPLFTLYVRVYTLSVAELLSLIPSLCEERVIDMGFWKLLKTTLQSRSTTEAIEMRYIGCTRRDVSIRIAETSDNGRMMIFDKLASLKGIICKSFVLLQHLHATSTIQQELERIAIDANPVYTLNVASGGHDQDDFLLDDTMSHLVESVGKNFNFDKIMNRKTTEDVLHEEEGVEVLTALYKSETTCLNEKVGDKLDPELLEKSSAISRAILHHLRPQYFAGTAYCASISQGPNKSSITSGRLFYDEAAGVAPHAICSFQKIVYSSQELKIVRANFRDWYLWISIWIIIIHIDNIQIIVIILFHIRAWLLTIRPCIVFAHGREAANHFIKGSLATCDTISP